MKRPALTPFQSRWLAEVIRQHEEAHGPLDDQALLAELLAGPPDAEQRILLRAERLGEREGWRDALLAWRAQARNLLFLLALFALFSGFAAALGVMGAGQRLESGISLNVIWVLGALLGMPLLTLMLWLASLFAHDGADTLLGRFWWWLNERLAGKASRHARIGAGLSSLLVHHGLLRWLTASVTHLLWTLALASALAGVLLMLAIQRHIFVWETTILPTEAFITLIGALGWLPGLLGFATPDADMIRTSGNGLAQTESARLAWSSWLAGCLIVYGLAPRLLAWLVSHGLWSYRHRGLRLDLSLPGHALQRTRLIPDSRRLGVVDQAPSTWHAPHIQPHPPLHGQAHLLTGMELEPDLRRLPALPPSVSTWPVIESREDRRQLLQAVSERPPARLLLALDARLTPDRGTLAYVADLAMHAETMAIWLMAAERSDPDRLQAWRDALIELGMPTERMMDDASMALRWLGMPHD
ncbi:MAG: DUF2868 domain-containing protein [Pseudomonadota bacterium]